MEGGRTPCKFSTQPQDGGRRVGGPWPWIRVFLFRWLLVRSWSVPLAMVAILAKKMRFFRPSSALLAVAIGVACCHFLTAI
ncbi:MAG: hypothetical protein LBP65_00560 [Puniceicoccales bacterium]|jgi:hypothetical protein|nr:hypothetical protein [Puniceicoccales bacterium]